MRLPVRMILKELSQKEGKDYELKKKELIAMLEKIINRGISRREFLKGAVAGIGLSLMPGFLRKAEAGDVDYESIAKQMEELNAKKQYDKVIQICRQYENDSNNKSALFFNECGLAEYNIGDQLKAKHHFLKSLHINPNDPITNYNYGLLSGELGDKREGIKYLRKSLMLDPKHKFAKNARAWINYFMR